MYTGVDRFVLFVEAERARHIKRWRVAALLAALIAVLLTQTQWIPLRPGLGILLAGQMGVALALVSRNLNLSKHLDSRRNGAFGEAALPGWFASEESFVRRLSIFEAGCQMLGFMALGYEFWIVTHSLWLALAIGLVYPATAYLGMARRSNLQRVREIRNEREKQCASGQVIL